MYLLQGLTFKDAAEKAGYTPSSARSPSSGLPGQRRASIAACVREARALAADSDPTGILSATRKKLRAAVELFDPATHKLGDIAKVAKLAETFYSEPSPAQTVQGATVVERITYVRELLRVAEVRGVILDRQAPLDVVVSQVRALPVATDNPTESAQVQTDQEDTPINAS